MHQIIEDTTAIIVAIGLVACLAFICVMLYFVVTFLRQQTSTSKGVTPVIDVPKDMPKVVPEKTAVKYQEAPGTSCGHCGARIKGNPVSGILVDKDSYTVYVCPICRKKTLLPAIPV